MFVRCFFFDVFFHASTASAEGISRIEDVDDDVAGVNDFVQLVPYSLALRGISFEPEKYCV